MLSLVAQLVRFIGSLSIVGIFCVHSVVAFAGQEADADQQQYEKVNLKTNIKLSDMLKFKQGLRPSEVYNMKLSQQSTANEIKFVDKIRPNYEYKKSPYRNWENFSTPNAGMYQQMESYNSSLNPHYMSNDKNLKAGVTMPIQNNSNKGY